MIARLCKRSGRTFRLLRSSIVGAIGAGGLLLSAPALAQVDRAEMERAVDRAGKAEEDLRSFYAARDYQALWFANDDPAAANAVVALLRSVKVDGWKPKQFDAEKVADAVDEALTGDERDKAKAEVALSRAFASYVQATRKPRADVIKFESAALAPVVPSAPAALAAASKAPSLSEYVTRFGWMHPYYGPLREALATTEDPDEQQILRVNLERARALPSNGEQRYVLVDAAAARLSMMEGSKVRDTMKVVVGKPEMPTPMMAGFIRYAVMNPYWNIPPDLIRERIAVNVLDQGVGYLKARGYQVMSGWDDDAAVIDPSTVDWRAVVDGSQEVRIRQLPGGDNFMGKMKFMFPNEFGVYLHDTPEKGLLREDVRTKSSGCVRLEDAARLGKWLYGKPLKARGAKPEQRIDLPAFVPVYITYFTRVPEQGRIVARADPYARDASQLAQLDATLARR